MSSRGIHYLAGHRVQGTDPLVPFSPNAPAHLRRADGFEHVADIMVGSLYDPALEQRCAFEELISFHGLGGPQSQPFLLYAAELPAPSEPIVDAAHVHDVLMGLRVLLRSSPGASRPTSP